MQDAVRAAHAVEGVDEDRPDGGVGDDVPPHLGSGSEEEERERDERDSRNRPEELEDDEGRVEQQARASDDDAEHDPDDDREGEPSEIGHERDPKRAGELAGRDAVPERGQRLGWRRDGVVQVELLNRRLREQRHEHDDEPAGDVHPLAETVDALHVREDYRARWETAQGVAHRRDATVRSVREDRVPETERRAE